MSAVFAFNVAEDSEPMTIDGHYDAEEQVWVGDSTYTAGLTRYSTRYRVCDSTGCYDRIIADYDCDPGTPGPC